jgi:Kinesin motor domain
MRAENNFHPGTSLSGQNLTLKLQLVVQIFETIERSTDVQFLVRASFLEIYNEEIRDLLAKDSTARLDLKEHQDSGLHVRGLSTFILKSAKELCALLEVGDPVLLLPT